MWLAERQFKHNFFDFIKLYLSRLLRFMNLAHLNALCDGLSSHNEHFGEKCFSATTKVDCVEPDLGEDRDRLCGVFWW